MDLVTFLAARLDEDEAAAKAAQEAAPEQSGHWHAAYSRDDLNPSDWLSARRRGAAWRETMRR